MWGEGREVVGKGAEGRGGERGKGMRGGGKGKQVQAAAKARGDQQGRLKREHPGKHRQP